MKKNEKKDWVNEFNEYLLIESVNVPISHSTNVLAQIHQELNPTSLKVFGKISLIHFAMGLLTLLFCPQFGISVTSGLGLMPYLMKFGDSICMLGCGAVFTSLSLFTASLVLKPEEVRVLKQNQILQLATLSTLSLGAFLCIGGEIVFALGLAWILGAIIGGTLSLEVGWKLRLLSAKVGLL